MTHRPHLLINSSRRAYIWAGDERGTLPNLATDRFSPMSALLYLLGTSWNGDRVALVNHFMSRADLPTTAWANLGDAAERGAIWHDDPILANATASAAKARSDVLSLDASSHKDRAPCMVVNYDLRQRLDPVELGDGASLLRIACGALGGIPGGTQTALTLLLAGSSRGRAKRGDLPTNSPLVGSWAGCRIGVLSVNSPDAPRGAESITGEVVSVMEAAHLASYTVNAYGERERNWSFERGREKYLRKFRGTARHKLS